jgi:hypothetical protein
LVLHDAADTQLTDLPSFLQPVLKHVLVPAAKLLGFKAQYPSHVSAYSTLGTSHAAAPDSVSQAEDVLAADHDELVSSKVDEELPESAASDSTAVSGFEEGDATVGQTTTRESLSREEL